VYYPFLLSGNYFFLACASAKTELCFIHILQVQPSPRACLFNAGRLFDLDVCSEIRRIFREDVKRYSVRVR
jgi:hypothetical protein